MLTHRTSVVMVQEVHLTQQQGETLLALLRTQYDVDGEYAAGVPGTGAQRPRLETAEAALRQQWGSRRPPHPAGPS